jgi:hypothetical protein
VAYAALAVTPDPASVYMGAITSVLWRAAGVQPVVVLMGTKKEWQEQVAMGAALIDLLRATDQLAIFVAPSVPPPALALGAFATMAPLCTAVLRFLKPADTLLLSYNGLLPLRRAYLADLRERVWAAPGTVVLEGVPAAAEDPALAAPLVHSQAVATVATWRDLLGVGGEMTFGECAAHVLNAEVLGELQRSVGAAPDDVLAALPSDMLAQLLRYWLERLPDDVAARVHVDPGIRDLASADGLRGPPGPWRAAVAADHGAAETMLASLVDAWAGPGPLSLAPVHTGDVAVKWAILAALARRTLPPGHADWPLLQRFHATFVDLLRPPPANP